MMVEVLVEYEDSRREPTLDADNMANAIVESVKSVADKEVSVFIGAERFGEGEAHFLQRWSKKWG